MAQQVLRKPNIEYFFKEFDFFEGRLFKKWEFYAMFGLDLSEQNLLCDKLGLPGKDVIPA